MYDPLAKASFSAGNAGVCHHIWMPFWFWPMFWTVSIAGEQSHIPLDLSIDMIYNMFSLFKPTSPGSTEKSFILSTNFYCISIFSSSLSFPSFSSPEQTTARPPQHLPHWLHRWLPLQLPWWSIFTNAPPSHRFSLSLASARHFCDSFPLPWHLTYRSSPHSPSLPLSGTFLLWFKTLLLAWAQQHIPTIWVLERLKQQEEISRRAWSSQQDSVSK